MKIEYRELHTEDDYTQCIELQKDIFNFNDINVISPLFFKLINRKDPSLGIALGVFKTDLKSSELIGVIVGFATFKEKSIYTVLMGLKPDYQNKMFGYKLSLKYKELALSRSIENFYAVIEPLDANIARFDIGTFGYIGYKYELDNFEKSDKISLENFPNDKLLIHWNYSIQGIKKRMYANQSFKNENLYNSLKIVTDKDLYEDTDVLVEIPENFNFLKKNNIIEALNIRNKTRNILNEYINNRNYTVSNCISYKEKNVRKTYYLLTNKRF